MFISQEKKRLRNTYCVMKFVYPKETTTLTLIVNSFNSHRSIALLNGNGMFSIVTHSRGYHMVAG